MPMSRYCEPVSKVPEGWTKNGKDLWKCPSCGRTGLLVRHRHLAWPPPVQIPVYGERYGSRNEVVAHALVSPIDAHLVSYKWRLTVDGYVYRPTSIARKGMFSKGVNLYMHRQILGLAPGDPLEGHHRNDNPLDNQRGEPRGRDPGDQRALQVQPGRARLLPPEGSECTVVSAPGPPNRGWSTPVPARTPGSFGPGLEGIISLICRRWTDER